MDPRRLTVQAKAVGVKVNANLPEEKKLTEDKTFTLRKLLNMH